MNSLLLATFRRATIISTTSRMLLSTNISTPRPEIAKILRSAQAYCFDVDSTVITKEGIDELAAYKTVGKEVAALTSQCVLVHL